MKTLLVVLTIFFSSYTLAFASEWRNMNSFVEHSGFDDIIHVGVGATVAYLIKEHSDLTGWKLRATMIAVPLAIGLLKESTDKHFDSGDIAGYGAGAAGVVIFTF